MRTRFTVKGHKQVLADIAAMEQRARDLKPGWEQVNRTLARQGQRLFDTEGASGASGAWLPTAKAGQTLVDQGDTRESLANPNGRGRVAEIGPWQATFGTRVQHARFHQYGTRTLPIRRVIDPTRQDIDEVAGVLEGWVEVGEVKAKKRRRKRT